ncbi:hypothetical protein AAMO2058_000552900 [Amorphochlora amoebiformis]
MVHFLVVPYLISLLGKKDKRAYFDDNKRYLSRPKNLFTALKYLEPEIKREDFLTVGKRWMSSLLYLRLCEALILKINEARSAKGRSRLLVKKFVLKKKEHKEKKKTKSESKKRKRPLVIFDLASLLSCYHRNTSTLLLGYENAPPGFYGDSVDGKETPTDALDSMVVVPNMSHADVQLEHEDLHRTKAVDQKIRIRNRQTVEDIVGKQTEHLKTLEDDREKRLREQRQAERRAKIAKRDAERKARTEEKERKRREEERSQGFFSLEDEEPLKHLRFEHREEVKHNIKHVHKDEKDTCLSVSFGPSEIRSFSVSNSYIQRPVEPQEEKVEETSKKGEKTREEKQEEKEDNPPVTAVEEDAVNEKLIESVAAEIEEPMSDDEKLQEVGTKRSLDDDGELSEGELKMLDDEVDSDMDGLSDGEKEMLAALEKKNGNLDDDSDDLDDDDEFMSNILKSLK